MSAEELKRIVLMLSNQAFVRYWLYYNYPEDPPLMAIAIMGISDLRHLSDELKNKGFTFTPDSFSIWTIPRTDCSHDISESC